MGHPNRGDWSGMALVAGSDAGDDSGDGKDGEENSEKDMAVAGIELRLAEVSGRGEHAEKAESGEKENEDDPEADGVNSRGSGAAERRRGENSRG